MKFRYIILTLDGSPPQGTNDAELAAQVGVVSEDTWIIDAEEGVILEHGEDNQEMTEVQLKDWEDAEESESEEEDD